MDYDGHSYAIPAEFNNANLDTQQGIVAEAGSSINFDQILLSKVKGKKSLYDPDDDYYGRRESTESTWNIVVKEIVTEFQGQLADEYPPAAVENFIKTVTVNSVKHRWRQLRQYFSAERIKREAGTGKVGGGFTLYNDMQFLVPYVTTKPVKRRSVGTVPAVNIRKRSQQKIMKLATSFPKINSFHQRNSCDNSGYSVKKEILDLTYDLNTQQYTDDTDENESLTCENNENDGNSINRFNEQHAAVIPVKNESREAERLFAMQQEIEFRKQMLEKRKKQIEEDNQKKIMLDQQQKSREMENARSLKLNEACANTVATMLSSVTTEKKRRDFASQIWDIIYKS